jgi:hypothetical protein
MLSFPQVRPTISALVPANYAEPRTGALGQSCDDDPPATWQTVQRLAGLGYDWHNVMHMIAAVVGEDLHRAMTEARRFDPDDYARRLHRLPGD